MRKIAPQLLLLGLTLVVSLALAEGALRLLWHNPYRHEAPDRLLKLAIQHANTDHRFNATTVQGVLPEVRLRTDSRSYILPSFQHPDPDLTVAFLGGSTTENSLVQEDERFPARVASGLAADGWRVNTLNAGRSGNTLQDSLNVLLNHVVLDRPDIAVVMHATNDIGLLLRDPEYRTRMGDEVDLRKLSRWSLQLLSSRLSLVAIARRAALGRIVLPAPDAAPREPAAASPPVERAPYRARLAAFVHLCQDLGIEPVLMTQPLSSRMNALTPAWIDLGNQELFNREIREVGRELDVVVVDLVGFFAQQVPGWDEPMKIFYDGMHFTDEGSGLAGRYIADQLRPLARTLIAKRRSRAPKDARR